MELHIRLWRVQGVVLRQRLQRMPALPPQLLPRHHVGRPEHIGAGIDDVRHRLDTLQPQIGVLYRIGGHGGGAEPAGQVSRE